MPQHRAALRSTLRSAPRPALRPALALGATAALLLAGCAAPAPERTPAAVPRPPATSTPAPEPQAVEPLAPTGEVEMLVSGLSAPWSVVPLANGSALITERDGARILEATASGEVREVGTVPGVVPGGEGGLLGIAVPEGGAPVVYAYLTAADDNRIVRLPLGGGAGSLTLGEVEEVLTGIPKNTTHNGGRIAFGPDGMLYATVGDAQQVDAAQDPASLSGKILRMTPDGAAPDDNPMPGSLVYSMGHRNPQGLAWDSEGGMWAAEFGQNTWDELNRIEPGANYGWPIVEGEGGDDRFVDPVAQWATEEASPSGIAIVGGTVFIANLRGERLWAVDVDGGEPRPSFVGELGRLRDAVAAPDGSLWMLTNNTDGRGAPREGDDRLVRIELGPAA